VMPAIVSPLNQNQYGFAVIRITAKPYWFWFNGETIAGITPRADLCPGIVSAFDDAKPRATTKPVEAPVTPVAARAEPAETSHPSAPAAKNKKKKKATSSPAKPPGTTAKAKEPAPPKPPE